MAYSKTNWVNNTTLINETSSFEIHAWNDLEQTAEIKGYMYIAIGKYK